VTTPTPWQAVTLQHVGQLVTPAEVIPQVHAAVQRVTAARALPLGPTRTMAVAQAMQTALQLAPFHPQVLHLAGLVQADLGHHADAAETLGFLTRTGLHGMAPAERAAVWRHYALALGACGRWVASAEAARHGLEAAPAHVGLLAVAHDAAWRLGQVSEARAVAARCLAAAPTDAAEAWTQAQVRCAAHGVTPSTLAGLAARHTLPGYATSRAGYLARVTPDVLALPRWHPADGPLDGRLIVVGEQGAGDVVMAARALPWVAERAGAPVVFAPGDLAPVYAEHPGVARAVPRATSNDGVAWCSALDAVAWVGAVPPAPLGPVVPAPTSTLPRPRVGLCWQGSRLHAADADRSAPPASLLRLIAAAGPAVEWVSLASGEPVPEGVPMAPWTAADWADTLARVSSCHAVVTVDTAVAHLAGTQGIPTWVVPPRAPEWRWGDPAAPTTPWYPSVTLIHRPRVEAWDEAWQRVGKAVRRWAAQSGGFGSHPKDV
jgi:hypothetical protein